MDKYTFGSRYPVTLDRCTLGISVKLPEGGWETRPDFVPSFLTGEGIKVPFADAGSASVETVCSGVGDGVRITLSGFAAEGKKLSVSFELLILQLRQTGELRFEFIPLDEEKGELGEIYWPGPLVRMDRKPGCMAIPMMQGMLLYDTSEGEVHPFTSSMVFSREFIMPWWGQYAGDGYLAIVDTPWDAKIDYHHLPGQLSYAGVQWVSSLGRAGYRRVMHLSFQKECDYVTLAKAFRAYVKRTTGLTTLTEKAVKNPLVKEMLGMPVVNTPQALYNCQPESPFYTPEEPGKNHVVYPFEKMLGRVEELREKGLKRAYYHIDGWGSEGYDNLHPDILPPCPEAGGTEGLKKLLAGIRRQGSLSALHDQYRDYYTRAASFDEENAIQYTDGTLYSTCEWLGGDQRALCTQLAPDYLARNYDRLEEAGVQPDGAYLDVFSVIELDECDNPRHRMSRRECMEKRIECMEAIRARGMLISSEEPMYGFVNHMDLVHHGPYIYALLEVYHLESPMIPVPLFNLVYHDCLLIPWFLGVDGWGLPPKESGLLHGLLNGGLPMVDFNADSREIQAAEVMSRLHRKVGCLEMTGHRFLPDGSQQTAFSDGTLVTVNFKTGSYEIAFPEGEKLSGQAL